MSYNPPQTPSDGSPWNEPADAEGRRGEEAQQPRPPENTGTGGQGAVQPGTTAGGPEKGASTDLDPNLDGRAKGGISGATWVALIIGLVILILLLVFILQNLNDVLITYMSWQFTLPLGVAMLLSAIAGALIMAMVGSIRLIVVTRRLHRLEKERESIKRTLR